MQRAEDPIWGPAAPSGPRAVSTVNLEPFPKIVLADHTYPADASLTSPVDEQSEGNTHGEGGPLPPTQKKPLEQREPLGDVLPGEQPHPGTALHGVHCDELARFAEEPHVPAGHGSAEAEGGDK